MKILILSCRTGEGHNSAAHAVREEFDARQIESEIIDPISFFSEKAKDFVSDFYNKMISKAPRAFGVIYRASDLYSSTGLTSPVYAASATYAKNLNQYIRGNGYDAVLCTHIFGMEAMTAIRKRLDPDIPCFGIFTDYTCYPFSYETKLDGLFVPRCGLSPTLTEMGIPAETLYETGIPVAKKFTERVPMHEARKRLGLPSDKKILLVMSGGIGGGNVTGLCNALCDGAQEDFIACVLTGRNEKVRESLSEAYKEDPRIRPIPFTKEVNLYMNAADLMISKPGGLSSTEAAVANVPLLHVNAIPGCETDNESFFESIGMSRYAKNLKAASAMAWELVSDEAACEAMREIQRRTVNPNAAKDITDTIVRYVTEKQHPIPN